MRFNKYFSRFLPGGGPGQIALGADVVPVDGTYLGNDNCATLRWQRDFGVDATAKIAVVCNAPAGAPPIAGSVYVYDKTGTLWFRSSVNIVAPGDLAYFDIPMILPDEHHPYEGSFAFVPAQLGGEVYPVGQYDFAFGLSYRTGLDALGVFQAAAPTLYEGQRRLLRLDNENRLITSVGGTVDMRGLEMVGPTSILGAPQDVTGVWANCAAEVDLRTPRATAASMWVKMTINASQDVRFRGVCKHAAGHPDPFVIPFWKSDTTVAGAYKAIGEPEQLEWGIDQDQNILFTWIVNNTVPFLQLQVMSGVVPVLPALPATITEVRSTLSWAP